MTRLGPMQALPSHRERLHLRPAAIGLAADRHKQISRQQAVTRASKDDQPSREDRSNPNKADFSAYWSLKFREFFSKRRQYLQLARKRQEPPEIIKQLDEQIKQQEDKLEAARQQRRLQRLEHISQNPELQQKAVKQDQQLLEDIARAREQLHQPRLKLLHLTAVQLRQALRTFLMLPFTVPAKLSARWQAMFASQSYENFLMSEGERIWAFRNRMENERWFWEVFAVDRLLVPVAWTICYQIVVPDSLIWSVVVPVCFITWQNGRLPTPANLEWWLIMFFGLYWKCWDQVCGILALLFKWW
eukprot:GHRR01005199.1.p1 GENE.GHRR01005199.1~~GHRR01005199.1.p1  ORF type:complete len:302 (+),score=81.01 GHRR01005199.1:600-1505(+)